MFCCKACQKSINELKFEDVPNEGIKQNNRRKNIISPIERRYNDISNFLEINNNINNSNNHQNQLNNQAENLDVNNNAQIPNQPSNISNNNCNNNIIRENNINEKNEEKLSDESKQSSNNDDLRSEKTWSNESQNYIDNFREKKENLSYQF